MLLVAFWLVFCFQILISGRIPIKHIRAGWMIRLAELGSEINRVLSLCLLGCVSLILLQKCWEGFDRVQQVVQWSCKICRYQVLGKAIHRVACLYIAAFDRFLVLQSSYLYRKKIGNSLSFWLISLCWNQVCWKSLFENDAVRAGFEHFFS